MKFDKVYLLQTMIGIYFIAASAISIPTSAVKNTITEEERRGAPVVDAKHKKGESGKATRGVYSTSAATNKHQHYYLPSAYDSHIAATGHDYLGGGSGYYSGGSSGHSSGHSSSSSHGSSSQSHHGSSGYGSSGSGYNGFGSYGHGSSGGHSVTSGYGSEGGHGISSGHGSTVYGSAGSHGISSGHGSSGYGSGGHHGIYSGHGSTSYGGSGGHSTSGTHGVSSGSGLSGEPGINLSHGLSGGHGISLGHGHKGGSYGYGHGAIQIGNSALALKGLLIPLAGIALLGAAAAFSTNPVLLQLGVVGRRRRSIQQEYYPTNPYVTPDDHP